MQLGKDYFYTLKKDITIFFFYYLPYTFKSRDKGIVLRQNLALSDLRLDIFESKQQKIRPIWLLLC